MTFPYFGRKQRLAGLYPAPVHSVVIEPFGGSLGYSCHWRPEAVVAVDLDERVVAPWHRMMSLTSVPEPPPVGSSTDDLLVKVASYSEHALTSGTMTVTSRMVRDWESIHQRAITLSASMAPTVTYTQGSYTDLPDVEATWFIDPPYQRANRRGYLHGASGVDFAHLAEWCREREGQVIVCEQEGADWLPFVPLASLASHRGSTSSEVVWIS